MSNKIQLYKNDLPNDLKLGNIIAVDGEFMGLNVRRDPLCLIQISAFLKSSLILISSNILASTILIKPALPRVLRTIPFW